MQKRALLKKKLPELGVDGILVTDIINLRYLTGFTGSSGFFFITKKHSVFVTDFRYQEQAKKEVEGCIVRVAASKKTDTVNDLVHEFGVKKLGFEAHNVSFQTYKDLKRKHIKLKPLTDTVEDLRIIKSQTELFYVKKAVRRAEKAFRRLLPHIKTGATEQKLAVKLEGLLKEEGCKMTPFGVIVASGLMSALPHAKPTSRVIKKGDCILFDWGGECEGYYSDMTRMVALKGRHPVKQLEMYSVALAAQKRAMDTIKPGVKASAIDSAARGYIRRMGYGEHFGHGTGHGVGLAVHEKPFISWRSRKTVEAGMIFTIEPGIYLPDTGGVRIEDMVHVTNSGAEVLTTLPRKLKII